MPRSEGEPARDATRTTNRFALDRRSYLKLAGGAGAAALLSGRASAAFTRRGVAFNHTVDMVADAGCDPTGTRPCDQQITDAADDYTLLKFPPGEYKLTEKNVVLNKTNVGFLGTGDVRFKVPPRFNDKALVVDGGTGVLFEGIDLDQTAYGATPSLHLGADDDLRVHDVGLVGRGINPDSISKGDPGYSPGPGPENGNPYVEHFIYPIVRSPDGTGLVTDLHANNHGLMGTYNAGNGRCGIWVGIETKGTITFRNCRIEEFGMDGTYSSRTFGVVQFEGGVYRNNDENQIRIGSPGSYIDGAKLVIDTDNSDARNIDGATNFRGARVEVGHNWFATDVTIRNCDIAVLSTPHTSGGVVAQHTASQFRVENTRIQVDVDGVRGVLGQDPDGGVAYAPPAKPHAGTLKNVSITGDAAGHEAVKLVNRPDSVIDGCCIQQHGQNRDGVTLVGSGGSTVKNSTIDVTGQQINEYDCSVTKNNIPNSGSCPTVNAGTGSGNGNGTEYNNTLTIEGAPGADYELGVSGKLDQSTAFDATDDPNDDSTGSSASGQVSGGGRDSYTFSGKILKLVLRGGAKLYYNGSRIDPAEYLQNTVTIESQSHAEYTIRTSAGIVKSEAMGPADPNDTIAGRSATGQVNDGGRDSYAYPGEITDLSLDGPATVYRNGNKIDASHLRSANTLTIEAAPEASYELAANESVAKTTAFDATADPNDDLEGTSATGQVSGGGRDSYTFENEITRLVLDGGAKLYYNGDRIDPAEYLQNTVTIESHSYAEYTITTDDGIVKSAAGGAADPNDNINGKKASGHVAEGGRDSYAYPGEIVNLDITGDATVYRNGAEIQPSQLTSTDTLTIEAAPEASYEFAVTDSLEKTTAFDATADPNDDLEGTSATGQVSGGGRDSYVFSGNITRLVLDGGASLYYNGKKVDPAEYLQNTVTIESQTYGEYTIRTSDGIVKSGESGPADPNDAIERKTATGHVGKGGRDSYAYPGTITSLDTTGEVTVYRNGSVLKNLDEF